MSGFPLILAFVAAIVLMILAISKWKIHPFLSIMGISLVLGLVAGVPLVNRTAADGAVTPGLANVIGSGFSGTFTSIGIVIILGALIGTILEATGAALKLADMVIRVVGKKRPELAVLLMGWVVSIPVFCDSGFVILNPIRKALVKRTMTSSVAMTVALSAGLYISHVFIPPTPGPIAAASTLGIGDNLLLVMGMGALCSIIPLFVGYFFAKYIGKKVKAGDIIVANKNFGCGSSREHAPIAIKASGVSCVIAETFARIFYRNAINIGLPIIECPEAAEGIDAGDQVEIDFDSGRIYNRTKGTEFQGQAFPPFMQELISAGGLVNYINSKKNK